MIASVRGTVTALGPDTAVVDVGGVGLAVQCTPDTLAALVVGSPADLTTALIVREDSLTLFGFADADEKSVFEILQTATGIGPRLAQAALAVLRPDDLRRAVATEDLATLVRVPGIGRKGAQRLVFELRDRLGPPTGGPSAHRREPAAVGPAWREPVTAGLVNLGWPAREVERVLDELVAAEATGSVAELLRTALRQLDRA